MIYMRKAAVWVVFLFFGSMYIQGQKIIIQFTLRLIDYQSEDLKANT